MFGQEILLNAFLIYDTLKFMNEIIQSKNPLYPIPDKLLHCPHIQSSVRELSKLNSIFLRSISTTCHAINLQFSSFSFIFIHHQQQENDECVRKKASVVCMEYFMSEMWNIKIERASDTFKRRKTKWKRCVCIFKIKACILQIGQHYTQTQAALSCASITLYF